MKTVKILSLALLLMATIITISCKKKKQQKNILSNNSDYHSYYNAAKSHNMGQDCLTCHLKGGSGQTIFNLGGTVYDTSYVNTMANCTLELYTGPNGTGTLAHTIEVDALGNFYTTSAIDFNTPLYPAVRVNNSVSYMSFAPTTGACASCHGVITSQIYGY